jgi:small subunit ribosomal protein S17
MLENPEPEAVDPEPEAPAQEPDDPMSEKPQVEAQEQPTEPKEQQAEPDAPMSAESQEALHPKDARRRRRSTHTGEPRPPRAPEERQAERDAERAARAGRRRAYRVKARAKAAERRAARGPSEPPTPARRPTGRRKVRQGVVVSDRADKSITVRVDITRRHRLYEKTVRSSSTLHAHDERNEARAGDTVRVIESRPLSRTKRWRLVEVVVRAR